MKKILLTLIIFLGGCSTFNDLVDAFLMKYDNQEYSLITEIRTKASFAKENCNNVEESKKVANELLYTSTLLTNYAQHLPHNKPMQKATVELQSMIKGISDKYNSGSVSVTFCKIKFKNIEESAIVMQQSEGDKPK